MTNVEVILSIILAFDTLCLLFMYIKLSEVSWSMDILDDRSRSNKDEIKTITAGMQEMRKAERDKRIKKKMLDAANNGGFTKVTEEMVDYIYEVLEEEHND